MTRVIKNGVVVARSQNLRGILDYARKSPVELVRIAPLASQGLLHVRYLNGAHATTSFADYSVLREWVKARRSWPAATITTASEVEIKLP